jgi:hypothetical protein
MVARPRYLTKVALLLMMTALIHGDSFAAAMAIACVAYEDCLLLDATDIDITLVSRILSDRRRRSCCFFRSIFNLPVATLCPRRTRIDGVAVVDALADGEALDDLDAHYECEAGMLLSLGLFLRVVESSVVQTRCC